MAQTESRRTLAGIIDSIRLEAIASRAMPAEVAEYAAQATLSALSRNGRRTRQRARAYFFAVARKRLVRRYAGSVEALRVVVDTVVDDLSESGRTPREVWDEIARGWQDKMPADLVEEYRRRLCA